MIQKCHFNNTKWKKQAFGRTGRKNGLESVLGVKSGGLKKARGRYEPRIPLRASYEPVARF